MNSTYFSELLSSIAERGRQFLGTLPDSSEPRKISGLAKLCNDLLSGRGEASGTALAREALDRYETLDPEGKKRFFELLARDFGPSTERLESAVKAWLDDPTESRAADVHYQSEPRRIELLRRMNRAPRGAASLVAMRADLLTIARNEDFFPAVDRDFVHLLSSWFNRGFLLLRRIDWSSPAIVLEKLIRYEAVHEIRGWDDLRNRIDPEDRRCYAFFHPALVDDPLIFLEVALTTEIPRAVAPLLASERKVASLSEARVAVFYSISNCLLGLTGVSFGNFLIKQVVEELRRELPKLSDFVTLSPAPRFMAWLQGNAVDLGLTGAQIQLLEHLRRPEWTEDKPVADALKALVEPLAAHYFLAARTPDSRVIDPVARFHLGNGAALEHINWLGDRSPKSMMESIGLMVNYRYDLDRIESNHERYANEREVVASSAVRRLLRSSARKSPLASQGAPQRQSGEEKNGG